MESGNFATHSILVMRSAPDEADGGLALEFSNESALFVSKKESGYESYQIWDGSSEIIR